MFLYPYYVVTLHLAGFALKIFQACMNSDLTVSVKERFARSILEMEESQNDALKYHLDRVCQQNSLEPENIWSLLIVEQAK